MIPSLLLILLAQQPGPVPGGGQRLVSGWIVKPAGQQISLSNLPMNARLSADGQVLFVLQAGHATPSVTALRAGTGEPLSTVTMPDAWLGLAIAGNRLFVGGGNAHAVHELAWDGQKLTLARSWKTPDAEAFVGDVQVSGNRVYAASLLAGAVLEFDASTGKQVRSIATGPLPYRILVEPEQLLVTSWSDRAVYRHRLPEAAGERWPAGDHSSDIVKGPTGYFVAAANTNEVWRLGADGAVRERINVALTPKQPMGMTPSALTLSADARRLYVTCSDANAVAVVDVATERSRVLGFIPTGWYPTAVQLLPDKRLAILNGKGLRSFPNNRAEGKQPFTYVAGLQKGTMSLLAEPDAAALSAYSKTVFENTPYRDNLLRRVEIPKGNPIPSTPGSGASPIKHVIYVVKENRTYDQVFGGLGKGNGDPSLVLFDEQQGPNHYKLAREFVLFDNFYVNGDVSADGHIWSAGAIAPDYTQKLYPNLYAGRGGKFSLYYGRPPVGPSEKAAHPAGGYLWDAAFEKGLSVRNYGWLVKLIPGAKEGEKQWSEAASEKLGAVTSHYFRGYDLDFPDRDRMKWFLKDLAESEKTGQFPALTVMRLSNDHTSGFRAGAFTPSAMFADNDLALGQLVEAMSKSRFWKNTAIFVLEDDAQSGPDHVDSHRSIAFVISPYTRRGTVDSTMYNTTSMLRTIGLILGTRPLTHFDAAAMPMWRAFMEKPDLRPYACEAPRVSLTSRNPASHPLAARSARLELEEEADLSDDHEFNDILYLGIQGRRAPAPLRSWFAH